MKKQKSKPLTLRQAYKKYPYLNPKKNTWIRQEHLDFDYVHKLLGDEKALETLNQFVKEYYNATSKGAKFYKTKGKKKECTDDNNARNRCVYGRSRTIGGLCRVNEEILGGEESDD